MTAQGPAAPSADTAAAACNSGVAAFAHPARARLLRHLQQEGGDPELLRLLQDAVEDTSPRQRHRRSGRDEAGGG
ncbi:hypothetical protein [Falsiroseomonas sp. HW251]|uniref:hypothetical protein n=1 Tax=Falsiroseomonas sp. HW251 TaxID=3390998 RepID=UPI003D3200BA